MTTLDCKGCNTYDEADPHIGNKPRCRFNPQINDYVCPCYECVVKVVCNKPCGKWFNYVRYMYKSGLKKESGWE